jgi:ketosteroid isomerase-like protein
MRTRFGMMMCFVLLIAMNVMAQNNDMSDVRTKIENMNKDYDKAFLSKDYTTMNNYFTDDAISLPSYAPMVRGKDAILESDKKMDMGTKYNSFTTTPTDVYGNNDIICEIGTYELSFNMTNQSTPMTDKGKYVNIWQKQSDGSLKIKTEIWNSDVNPMSMNQAGAKPKSDMDDK